MRSNDTENKAKFIIRPAHYRNTTRSSATAEWPRDALC